MIKKKSNNNIIQWTMHISIFIDRILIIHFLSIYSNDRLYFTPLSTQQLFNFYLSNLVQKSKSMLFQNIQLFN